MKTVNCYTVDIRDGSGLLGARNEFSKTVLKIVAENDKCIAVDDSAFSTIYKVKRDYATCLDKKSIRINASDKLWGNSIAYDLYTTKTVRASTIKKQIEKEIAEKFGYFTGKIDLSIIKDAK